jgi:DNA-binding MarR family transcriptional regulator
MNFIEVAEVLKRLKLDHDVDGHDIVLINEVNKLGDEAFVMRVIAEFPLTSRNTTHTRIKELIKKGLLTVELDGENMRTKRLVLTDKLEEVLYAIRR